MNRLPVDVDADTVDRIVEWVAAQHVIDELWLFGSRAKGTSRPDSDIDLAAIAGEDPATGAPFRLTSSMWSEWHNELVAIAGRHVSFVLIEPGQLDDRGEPIELVLLYSRAGR